MNHGTRSVEITQSPGIILINTGIVNIPLKERVRHHEKYPPFGLLHLESCLRMHGYRTLVCDLASDVWTKDEFIRCLREFDTTPLAIGLSAYTENVFLVPRLIEDLRVLFPYTRIIVGGPHVSFLPEEGLNAGADYVVQFEGESTLVALLEHIKYPEAIPIESVRGITYRPEDGGVSSTGRRAELRELDFLPFSESFFRREKDAQKVYMVTSRGCPGTCIFCSSGAYSGRRYRQHSAERLWSMIYYSLHKSPHLTHIEFIDDTFTVNRRRLTRLFAMINSCRCRLTWGARSRVDGLSREFIRYLADNGCTALHLGVESVRQFVLDAVKKETKIGDFYSNYRHMISNGIMPRCSFIIGNHADTLESIEETLMCAVELEGNELGMVAVSVSTPFPGTPLYDLAGELGITIDSRRWKDYNMDKPVYHTGKFQRSDIRRAVYLFYNEKEKLRQAGCLSGSGRTTFHARITNWIAELRNLKASDHKTRC